jgi:hypothetical protein
LSCISGTCKGSPGGQCYDDSHCIGVNGTTARCINNYCEAAVGDTCQSQVHCQSSKGHLICNRGICQAEPGDRCNHSTQCWQPFQTARHPDWKLGPNAKFVCKNETCLPVLSGPCQQQIDCFPNTCGPNGKCDGPKASLCRRCAELYSFLRGFSGNLTSIVRLALGEDCPKNDECKTLGVFLPPTDKTDEGDQTLVG